MSASSIAVSADHAYQLAQVGRVLLVRLSAPPTPPALAALAAEVTEAREKAGAPLDSIWVIPGQAAGIAPEIRPVMTEFGRYVETVSASLHLVIESTGFAGTIMRSAVTAVLLASRARRVKVVSRFDEAFAALRPSLSTEDARELEATARVLGVAG
jgi:hypothetical protein